MAYYLIKNKDTGLWDICTNNLHNPPLEKYIWAGDFNTEKEANDYLNDTLKKLKDQKSSITAIPYYKPQGYSSPNKSSNVIGKLFGYIFVIVIIIGIAWVASFFRTSTSSSSPELTNLWVNQLFQNVSSLRNLTISNCNNLNAYAAQRYNTLKDGSDNQNEWDENLTYLYYNLNQNETILAPIELENSTPISYTLSFPKTYAENNWDNDTQFSDDYYLYYGYFIYSTTGLFNSSGTVITASTQHVLIELSNSCN